jgi:RNA polymerase sigma factor (sigma-70 family)
MTGAADGGSGPVESLLPSVYDELRAIARSYFRRQPASFTLCPTEIVHEACLHLIRHGPSQWDSPQHFRAIATRKIWQVIVDHLKHREAVKRGGSGGRTATADGEPGALRQPNVPKRVPLETVTVDWVDRRAELLDVAEALEALEKESARLHDVALLHWFGGLSHDEVARVLAVSASTAEKDWRYAVAWLKRRLSEGGRNEH